MSILPPPFVLIEGIINIRSVGGFATINKGLIVKPQAIFRSGEVSGVTENGKGELRALGVKKIFDLRSEVEINSYKTKAPTIEGIEVVWAPITPVEAQDQEKRIQRYAGPTFGEEGLLNHTRLKAFATDERAAFLATYMEILEIAGAVYELIFTHIRDHPEDTCLVHCTAGKDRTGLFICLLLMLVGVSDEDIAEEYALTAVGLQPAMAVLAARFEKEAVYRENWQGALNMVSSRAENMRAVIEAIREKYGGAEGWIKSATGLTDADMAIIRANLLVQTVEVLKS